MNYNQLDKNTASAENQLKESNTVKFDTPCGSGKRIMFLGNSITLNGVKSNIGWHWCFGMAAIADRIFEKIQKLL